MGKIKTFISECKRVLMVTKKPDSTEYKTIVKVAALGMILIGSIGFLLFIIKEMLL
jgi:protein transport protein SEC61 subunit gamma and related proteins